MANTFLVLRTNDTSPQLFFHNGTTVDPTGLGALPGAVLEDLTAYGGARLNVRHNNRCFSFLDMTFVIQDNEIFVSTDEGATFASDHTLTASGDTYAHQTIGPVPVMVQGALKLIGFYRDGTDAGVYEYDVAGDSWSNASTSVAMGGASGQADGFSTPVVLNGLVYVRAGHTFIAYDPVSTGTVTLSNVDLSVTLMGQDQWVAWNGSIWSLVHSNGGATPAAAVPLVGSSLDLGTNGVVLPVPASHFPVGAGKSGTFIDPNTGNLIVIWTGVIGPALYVHRITPGLVATDITGTVAGAGLTALGSFGINTRFWPHITRVPGGTYSVVIYASRGADTTDPIEKFTWINDATNLTEHGVVGGSADMSFPYAIHGGDYDGFFPGEKRTIQTAQTGIGTGLKVTCEAFEQGGSTLSVRGHYDNVGVGPNALTLAPMTLGNPTGTGGLSVSGSNPGAQVDGMPADRTPVQFDWDQVTDGFTTGDSFNFQLEAL